ncbi:MAG: aryl-sulfate sulfotransferase, partial [Planctomycetota bacterium]
MARRRWMPLAIVLLLASPVSAQSPSPGQTLISTANGNDTHLMELDGTVVQTWTGSYRPSSFAYLLDGGSVLRPTFDFNGSFSGGGIGGRIQRIDSTNTIVWDYYFSTSDYQQHHDIEPMPNGNLLIVAWERKSNAEAIAAGRQGIYGEIWPTLIAEVMPQGATGGTVVWEWHFWDHIIQDVDPAKPNYGVVADHPELLDLNYGSVSGGGDWVHVNSIDYDPVHDQIVFSSRSLNEVYVIDHSTTTAEAAGHTGGNSGMGGDILYRWGNPQAYDRGTSSDREFDVVHGANFIDEGHPGTSNILAFNNGDRPGFNDDYSSVFEIDPPRNGFGFD